MTIKIKDHIRSSVRVRSVSLLFSASVSSRLSDDNSFSDSHNFFTSASFVMFFTSDFSDWHFVGVSLAAVLAEVLGVVFGSHDDIMEFDFFKESFNVVKVGKMFHLFEEGSDFHFTGVQVGNSFAELGTSDFANFLGVLEVLISVMGFFSEVHGFTLESVAFFDEMVTLSLPMMHGPFVPVPFVLSFFKFFFEVMDFGFPHVALFLPMMPLLLELMATFLAFMELSF